MVYQAERPNPKQTPCTEMKQSFISERRSHEAIWIFRGRPQGRMRKRNERSVLRRRWPVGQEVKTGASHAPNVGSIPARVTNFYRLLWTNLFTNQLECAILLRQAEGRKESKDLCFVSFLLGSKLVSMTTRVHPFPFRTRKLSSSVATILVWRRTGKIARCQHKNSGCEGSRCFFMLLR